jgi:glycosyltransferase involved in cell wall biosynthesis
MNQNEGVVSPALAGRPRTAQGSEGNEAPGSVYVAIVIPAYNEVKAVGLTVDGVREALEHSSYSYEIIVVDDGSTDKTGAEALKHGARVVTLAENSGYGSALKAGIRNSVSELVVIIDADGTYPPADIPKLVALAEGADMVVGARAARDVSIPFVRRPAKWALNRLAGYLAGQHIPDLNSGLRVLRRSVLNQFLHILPPGFSFTMTITLSLLCTSHRVVYEPVVCEKRIGSSKIRATDTISFLILVLRTVVLFNPLKVFLPFGSILFLVGLAKLIYDIYLWNLSESAVMMFMGAAVIWSVGLLADLISRLELNPPRLQ